MGWYTLTTASGEKLMEVGLGSSSSTRTRKIFISHSSLDMAYVKPFVELLEDIGVPDNSIVCSSVPDYGVPEGEDIFDWLGSQFVECDLHVVYALSSNYYKSPVSLNEMGAAWVVKADASLLLLPGFDFGDIRGCVNPRAAGTKLDGPEDELKVRLGELKDKFVKQFVLERPRDARWERRRDEFIAKIRDIALEVDGRESQSSEASLGLSAQSGHRIEDVADSTKAGISVDSAFLLVYAACGDGRILSISTLGSETLVQTAGKSFNANSSHREAARWVEALDTLVVKGLARPVGSKGQVFEVTGTGYKVSDKLKAAMGIDTSHDPLEELERFE
jgi:hypothetical protein